MPSSIPLHIIEEVKERAKADILLHVSQRVVLKARGQQHYGLCPFHKEITPSFSVAPHKGFFKCFGCGFGGDVIKFLMRKENFTFIECIQYLVQYYNIHY